VPRSYDLETVLCQSLIDYASAERFFMPEHTDDGVRKDFTVLKSKKGRFLEMISARLPKKTEK
jgi:hypothetical protein